MEDTSVRGERVKWVSDSWNSAVTDKESGTIYRTPRSFRIFHATLLVLMTVLILTFTIWIATGWKSQQGPPLWLAGILPVLLVWIWYWYLGMVREIRIQDTSTVEFRSSLRRISIPARSIRMVRLQFFENPHRVAIFYGERKLHVMYPIQGFYKFLAWLEEVNPAVEIRNL